MYNNFQEFLKKEIGEIREAGTYKEERVIVSPQQAEITLDSGQKVLNFCMNNYLGLSNNDDLKQAAREALDSHGYGMSSVRFICGTQDLHKKLEAAIAKFFGTEDTILYAAAFDANGGLFEPLFGPEDAIISDSLNHASIIDGVRLCKAKRYRYENANMEDLEEQLKKAQERMSFSRCCWKYRQRSNRAFQYYGRYRNYHRNFRKSFWRRCWRIHNWQERDY
jgi:glycine C-acetyltransferase